MIRLKVKNSNMILIEKLQKYQYYDQEKLKKYPTGDETLISNQKK